MGKEARMGCAVGEEDNPMIKVMQVQIKTLEGLTRKQDNGNKSNLDNNDKHANITCWKCKKKGHIAKNCMEKKEEPKPEAAANKDKDKGKKTGPTSPFKIPPKDNQPKSKKIGDIDASWCSQCERWTKGEKRHLTEQHKTKAELQAAQVNVAASILPNSGLQMSHFH